MRPLLAAVALALAVVNCDTTVTRSPGRFRVTQGLEADVWTADPKPTRVALDRELEDGSIEPLGPLELPVDFVELPWGAPGHLQLHATDEDGIARAQARSVLTDPLSTANHELPLFVGRADRFSRPPGRFSTPPGSNPPVARLGLRYLLIGRAADRAGVWIDGYDFLLWSAVESLAAIPCPHAPCSAETLAAAGW